MVFFIHFFVLGIALFAGSLYVESKSPPAPVGDNALPVAWTERVWAAMRIAGVVYAAIGLCGWIILARAGF